MPKKYGLTIQIDGYFKVINGFENKQELQNFAQQTFKETVKTRTFAYWEEEENQED